ncbi:uncharacterized protein EAE98_007991 [Botrytis deweyae]|uniref:Uncharacterized protein n=1 Tax=Botrytis deweyae TaxID=2478750 RepID=A0ABQ7IFB5_9HELO|nr:uncharacterized protein EAE98_007991 [Botrytis deweyae]KAF7922465.1 hypothetical protein EAE98_007991 [Botrytis deweyae]
MCRPSNVARYYCDNDKDYHRYQPKQWWYACDQHPNPALRNTHYLETQQKPPCPGTHPPLPDDVCPYHRERYGDQLADKIQSHITELLALVLEAGNNRCLATGAPNIREYIFFDVERYSEYLEPTPQPGDQYRKYGNHPKHPPRPRRLTPKSDRSDNYLPTLRRLERSWIRNDIESERNKLHPDVEKVTCLVFQLFRTKIDYQEAWATLKLHEELESIIQQ